MKTREKVQRSIAKKQVSSVRAKTAEKNNERAGRKKSDKKQRTFSSKSRGKRSDAERKRRADIRAHPKKHEEYKKKERDRWHRRVSLGKIKTVDQMTETEKRLRRRRVRESVRVFRQRKKGVSNSELQTSTREEQNSLSNDRVSNDDVSDNAEFSEMNNFAQPSSLEDLMNPKTLANKVRTVRRVRKNKASCYRENKKLRAENDDLSKKVNRMRVSKCREKKANEAPLSPKSNFEHLMKAAQFDIKKKEQLFLGQALIEQIKEINETNKSRVGKMLQKKIVCGSVIKKYRLISKCRENIAPLRSNIKNLANLCPEKDVRNTQARLFLKNKVQTFFEDNSRMCPGKKDSITRNGNKKQKMYLNDDVNQLYKKFTSSNPNIKVSYSFFCKLKPFWTVKARISDRDTCLCTKHEKMREIVSALFRKGVMQQSSSSKLVALLCCDPHTEECLLRICGKCSGKTVPFNNVAGDEIIHYNKWEVVEETRFSAKTKKEIKVRRTVRSKTSTSVDDLKNQLLNFIPEYCYHILVVEHQQRVMQILKRDLTAEDLFFNIDFSQNQECKYAQELHGVHYGASRETVSLHTGVYMTKETLQSFCTLSTDLRHEPAAIVAHIKPVVSKVLEGNKNINTWHILSDGPTSQYRSKKMFSLLVDFIRFFLPQIKRLVYNFSESGHGKGAADGVGAVVKRTADRKVANGSDVGNFESLMKVLRESGINVFLESITKSDINFFDARDKSDGIAAFKGTMKAHQWIWNRSNPEEIYFNKMSCYECDLESSCKHYSLGKMSLIPKAQLKDIASRLPGGKSSWPKANACKRKIKDPKAPDVNSKKKKSNSSKVEVSRRSQRRVLKKS
ncbi:hypothetical protein QAD02_020457 [Eretmocerus hayati]|uniref:Uncharacterized protein n=1 Tax=Eretmocerus hayati TaxID=131215 RepID=A0ACC2PPY7_9HYME|nr:hypothetical protein QAD02_020457 [Eretmocerus hayati]